MAHLEQELLPAAVDGQLARVPLLREYHPVGDDGSRGNEQTDGGACECAGYPVV
jgi:hypothetical protein